MCVVVFVVFPIIHLVVSLSTRSTLGFFIYTGDTHTHTYSTAIFPDSSQSSVYMRDFWYSQELSVCTFSNLLKVSHSDHPTEISCGHTLCPLFFSPYVLSEQFHPQEIEVVIYTLMSPKFVPPA